MLVAIGAANAFVAVAVGLALVPRYLGDFDPKELTMQPFENERQIFIDQLTGPEGFFPVELQDVRGHQVPTLVNRKRSLRDFVQAAAAHGDADFLAVSYTHLRAHETSRAISDAVFGV